MKTKPLTPQQALDSTKRTQYVNKDVMETMPPGTGEPIQFFKLDRYVSNTELLKEYEKRGLAPASPIDLCAYDITHPEEMGEKKYVATVWDTDCYLAFGRWDGERDVGCYRCNDDWNGRWFLAGVPAPGKSSVLESKDSDTLPLTLIRDIEEKLAELKKLV